MRFYEMTKPPRKAGLAKLEYYEYNNERGKKSRWPEREEETILIPWKQEIEIFKLLPDWEQFLLGENIHIGAMGGGENLYFGGTDEKPFLTKITEEAFNAFRDGGPRGFYYSLLPPKITLIVQRFEVELKRQGDIFAMPFSVFSKKILKPTQYERSNDESNSVFGTRHILIKGVMFQVELWEDNYTIVEDGVICAPDHRDLKLPGLNFIEQANNLYDPQKAD